MFSKVALAGALFVASQGCAYAEEQVLNLYSARHHATDEALYGNFTKATGIRIRRVDADDAGILARLKAEGAASPADVILLVDAARLYKRDVDGLFKPIQSRLLEDAIPAQYHATPTAQGIARLLRSNAPEDRALMECVGVVFPNQQSWGTHVNIAGGAVAKNSRHADAAVKFLEYLASPEAQNYFANGNNEWPAARGVTVNNPALQAMSGGSFKAETIPIAAVGANRVKVQQMLDRVGFK